MASQEQQRIFLVKVQKAFDSVFAEHEGGDQPTIEAAIREQFRKRGVSLGDDVIAEASKTIAAGFPMKVQAG